MQLSRVKRSTSRRSCFGRSIWRRDGEARASSACMAHGKVPAEATARFLFGFESVEAALARRTAGDRADGAVDA